MNERAACVTGATRGIGREIARGLVAAGFRVIGTGRRAEDAAEAGAEIGFEGRALDLADGTSVAALLADPPGGLSVLVNNAGIALDGFDPEVARRTLTVNFRGPARLTDALLPTLAPGARVVNVSSGIGSLTSVAPALRDAFLAPDLDRDALSALADRFVADVAAGRHQEGGWPSSAYGVSKICLNAYTRILARELGRDPRGILVNAVCPGWVRTDMGGPSASRSPAKGAETPIWLARLPSGGSTGRFFRDLRPIPW